MAYSGKYLPKHVEKYLGAVGNIVYRSLWERRWMRYLDETPGVVRWSSEEIIIPYISPVDGKTHRYFVDFYLEVKQPDGSVKRMIVEVKPKVQTVAPTLRKKTKKFIQEVMTYSVNQAKWNAATEFAKRRGWTFLILTEDHLPGMRDGHR